jgi:hypothetical protein
MERALDAASRGTAAAMSAPYTFKDARGTDRPCEIVRRMWLRRWGFRWGMPERLRAHASRIEKTLPRSRFNRLAMLGGGLFYTLFSSWYLSFLLLRGPGNVYAIVSAVLMMGFGVSFLLGARRRHGKLEKIAPEILVLLTTHAGFCPGCLYDLTTTPRDEDGLNVCPECSAAWRIGVAESQ